MFVTTLDRYVFAELARTLFIALLAIILIFSLGATARLMRDDLTYWQLFSALPFAIVFTLPYALPMAFLIALSLTYGRLVADREVIALEASGVPARTLLAPGLALGTALALVSLVLQATYLPVAHRRKAEIATRVVEDMLELGHGENWTRVYPQFGFDIFVRKHDGFDLSGIVIHRDAGYHPMTVVAAVGSVSRSTEQRKTLILSLRDVTVTVFTKRAPSPQVGGGAYPESWGDPLRMKLDSYELPMPNGGSAKVKAADLTSAQLREIIAQDEAGAPRTPELQIILSDARPELATRAVLATAPLIFVLMAIPLTLFLRASNRLVPLVVSTLVVSVLFLAPLQLGVTLSERDLTRPLWPALPYATSVPAIAILALLARRAGRFRA